MNPLTAKVGLVLLFAVCCWRATAGEGREELDLSGSQWQMEGIRPGQGVKEGFHEHFGEVAPSTFIDYYRQPKLSFEFVKRAYQPLLVSLETKKRRWLPGDHFRGRLWIVNDLLRGDQEKAREDCAALARKFQDAKGRFPASDYYRFFPELSGSVQDVGITR